MPAEPHIGGGEPFDIAFVTPTAMDELARSVPPTVALLSPIAAGVLYRRWLQAVLAEPMAQEHQVSGIFLAVGDNLHAPEQTG